MDKEGLGRSAPTLKANGDKWNYQGSYSNETKKGFLFGQMPSLLRRYINNTLTGANGNLLKIMYLFIETQENANFKVSQAWVLKETGMAKNKYYDARTQLEKMGWIDYDSNENVIYINYDFLWQEALADEQERCDVQKLRKS